MAIKTFGSAQKIRVDRESGNTTFIFLGLSESSLLVYTNIITMQNPTTYIK